MVAIGPVIRAGLPCRGRKADSRRQPDETDPRMAGRRGRPRAAHLSGRTGASDRIRPRGPDRRVRRLRQLAERGPGVLGPEDLVGPGLGRELLPQRLHQDVPGHRGRALAGQGGRPLRPHGGEHERPRRRRHPGVAGGPLLRLPHARRGTAQPGDGADPARGEGGDEHPAGPRSGRRGVHRRAHRGGPFHGAAEEQRPVASGPASAPGRTASRCGS